MKRGQLTIERPTFIIDHNVGKLAKLLRLLGFDSAFFTGEKDSQMVNIALSEKRVILTRDTHILERRLITKKRVKALLIKTEKPEHQIAQVINELYLQNELLPFTLCLECNRPLHSVKKDEIQERVPPYVFQTQNEFVECPHCLRVYWKGTHWNAMMQRLNKLAGNLEEEKNDCQNPIR